MENANKALIMAASTLIGVMLFSLFVMFIQNISIWPETEDEILSSDQKSAFNAEYEVYQKSAMYGVDVISCLNKALSNNEKYAEGESFLSGLAYGEQYLIDVEITLINPISESIEVRAMNEAHKEVQIFNRYCYWSEVKECRF